MRPVRTVLAEKVTMKSLIIAMFLAGAALLLVALFWPTPMLQGQRNQRTGPTAGVTERREPPSIEPINRSSAAPDQPTVPAMPSRSAAHPVKQQADVAPLVPTIAKPSIPARDASHDSASNPDLTPDEKLTYKQTGTDDTSLRNPDFPRTYISKIHVDLTSPDQSVTLTWTGPQAKLHPPTSYHSSPGRGLGNNNCDDAAESCRVDSNCTPKGTFHVQAFTNSMRGSPEVRFVTWFDTKRGIALHFYPFVPNYPASHGCVRLGDYAAQLIHNNSKIGDTEIVAEGNGRSSAERSRAANSRTSQDLVVGQFALLSFPRTPESRR
jgi:hypothetical protein